MVFISITITRRANYVVGCVINVMLGSDSSVITRLAFDVRSLTCNERANSVTAVALGLHRIVI